MADFEQTFVRIAISKSDGGVAIMQFLTLVKRNEEDPGFIREATPANIEEELTKSGYGGRPWRIILDDEIPQDRTFRDAWTDTGKIEHDMEKARAIQQERLNRLAKAKTEEMAHEVLDALLDDNVPKLTTLRAKRTAILSIPGIDIAKAATVEDLKAMWPEELKG